MRQERQAAATLAAADLNVPVKPARRVRAAVSVFFGLVAVAFCLLWVRSYRWHDAAIRSHRNDVLRFGSNSGVLYVAKHRTLPLDNALRQPVWDLASWPADGQRIVWDRSNSASVVGLPHWSIVGFLAFAACATILRRDWRFSMRQLLMTTTIVALTLGLAIWMAR